MGYPSVHGGSGFSFTHHPKVVDIPRYWASPKSPVNLPTATSGARHHAIVGPFFFGNFLGGLLELGL